MSASEIDRLIELLAKLPGLGPRSARRVALHLIKRPAQLMTPLADALDQIGFNDRPLIFAVQKDSTKTLKEVFSAEDRSGMGQSSTMHRAIIMSGFLQREVHSLMTAFRQVVTNLQQGQR